jgi:hypothetical protein|tara:strand:+ start:617 stop:1600 length:984 start_codon:yes stop_codon:yes gene_type:complete
MAEPNEVQGIAAARAVKDLEYPLNNPDEYKGRLVFNVMEEPETDLGNLAEAASNIVKAGVDKLSEITGQTPAQTKQSVKEHKNGPNTSVPIIKERPLISMGRQVSLYLPAGLQYRDNVTYENFDLGGAGAGAEAALQGGSGAIAGLIEGGMSTLSAGLKGSANKDLAKLGAVKLAMKGPDEVAGAFRSAGGVTTNPNTRVLFKSVGLREFSFAFKFLATSAREAEEIKEIIKLFRTELYPDTINIPVGTSEISIGYRFPNKFQITVEYDGDEIATRIKPCFLRDVSVTYNNTSMSMHEDGNFTEIEMSLSFQETRTLSRKDVEEEGF